MVWITLSCIFSPAYSMHYYLDEFACFDMLVWWAASLGSREERTSDLVF